MDHLFDKVKSLFKKDNRSPEELIRDARSKLLRSREEYLNTIDGELRNIRYNRDNQVRDTDDEHSMMVIKKALYGISLIDQTEKKLNEEQSVKKVFNAMNITTEALNLVNQAMKKGLKPNESSFVKAIDKFGIAKEEDRALLETLFEQVDDVDGLIDDEAVKRLVRDETELSRIERNKIYEYTLDTAGKIFEDEGLMESLGPYDPTV